MEAKAPNVVFRNLSPYVLGGIDIFCSHLQIDGVNILLDCGWCESCTMLSQKRLIEELGELAPKLDMILLSQSSMSCVGLYPYLMNHMGVRSDCRVYCTNPVSQMGRLAHTDFYKSIIRKNIENASEIPDSGSGGDEADQEELSANSPIIWSFEDIGDAFDRVHKVKYIQQVKVNAGDVKITIVALQSGFLLGGTIWNIIREPEDIIYAVGFNQRQDRHLNVPNFYETTGKRISLVIMDVRDVDETYPGRDTLKTALLNKSTDYTRGGGDVLIPTDAAGRMLELALLLEQHANSMQGKRKIPNICIVSNVAEQAVEYSKSMLEWMNDALKSGFDAQRSNAFNFRHVKLCQTMDELEKVPSPKIILAASPSLSIGFSRELLPSFCKNPDNLIIIAESWDVEQTDLISSMIYRHLKDIKGRPDHSFYKNGIKITSEVLFGEELVIEGDEHGDTPMQISNGLSDPETGAAEEDIEPPTPAEAALPDSPDDPPPRKKAKKRRIESVDEDDYGGQVDMAPFMSQTTTTETTTTAINGSAITARAGGDTADAAMDDEIQKQSARAKEERYRPDTRIKYRKKVEKVSLKSAINSGHEHIVWTICKCIILTHVQRLKQIQIRCNGMYIPLNAKADGYSIKNMLVKLNPRKLILLNVKPEGGRRLAKYLTRTLEISEKNVLIPEDSVPLSVGYGMPILKVNCEHLKASEAVISEFLAKKLTLNTKR